MIYNSTGLSSQTSELHIFESFIIVNNSINIIIVSLNNLLVVTAQIIIHHYNAYDKSFPTIYKVAGLSPQKVNYVYLNLS